MSEENPAIRPFRIAISDDEIVELKNRLAATRWPQLASDPQWQDGADLSDLQRLSQHWLDKYDWREHEDMLNRLSQFETIIDGAPVHFIHVRSDRPDAQPIILFHGWPSSIVEYRHVVSSMTAPDDPAAPAFHVVIPSLIGFGFSGPVASRDWGLSRMANAFAALMGRLGYSRFLAHGGDAGHFVASELARAHPDKVSGIHLSLGGLHWPTRHRNDPDLTPAEKRAIGQLDTYMQQNSGYAMLQSTRPHGLAYALTDSPVGQLAWIAEKFREWSDPAHPIDDEDLLTNVSLYWFTRTAGSSARIYKDSRLSSGPTFVDVPTGIAAWPHEIVTPSRRWVEADYNVVHWRDMPEGGHFPALEVPHLLVENIRRFRNVLDM